MKRREKQAVVGTLQVAWECPYCHSRQEVTIDYVDIQGGFRQIIPCVGCGQESEVYA